MAKKPAAALAEALPKTTIKVGDTDYQCSFDMDTLSDSEEFFNRQGSKVNLLQALSSLSLAGTRKVFACAVHPFHPELSFEQAKKLLTLPAAYEMAAHIVALWPDNVPAAQQAPQE